MGLAAHDAGHYSLFEDNRVNNTVGFILHTVRSDSNAVPFSGWLIWN